MRSPDRFWRRQGAGGAARGAPALLRRRPRCPGCSRGAAAGSGPPIRQPFPPSRRRLAVPALARKPAGKSYSVTGAKDCRSLFEQRVEQYLEELPDTEQSGVNKFLRGLGNKMKFLHKKN